MNLLFLSCAYSDNQVDEIREKSKRGFQFAAQVFQRALITGFLENNINLKILSFPAISTFPLGFKKPYLHNTDFTHDGKSLGLSLSIANLPFFNLPKKGEFKSFIDDWFHEIQPQNSAILVYGMNLNLLKIAKEIKKRNPSIPIVILIPDLPEYMGYNKIAKFLGLRRKFIKQAYKLSSNFDAYVLLTEAMNSRVNPSNKPMKVVEGIYTHTPHIYSPDSVEDNMNTVLYSGALSKRYGIVDLLESFKYIPDKNFKLLLCGAGDAVDDIKRYALIDNRIKYLGTLPNSRVRELQRKATVLVNPRHSSEVFTSYSFPSKTMEYLASGTPTIMSHLNCLTQEYLSHLILLEDETPVDIAKTIRKVCDWPKEKRREFGQSAASFIIEEKNAKIQTKKILDLINSL